MKIVPVSANCFPMQFRNPKEKMHTRISFTNFPSSSRNRVGLKRCGSGKKSGFCVTAVRDANKSFNS
jgi:hypothetical protein